MQGRLYRSLKLWSFYCDLEESLGTMESTQAVYDRILELRIATPQLILNYALFLQVRPCQLILPHTSDLMSCSFTSQPLPDTSTPGTVNSMQGALSTGLMMLWVCCYRSTSSGRSPSRCMRRAWPCSSTRTCATSGWPTCSSL